MLDFILSWSWISLILAGSFHGLNPAMGWLFAVALGIQEHSTRAVLRALGPIAVGHAVSIAGFVAIVWMLGTVMPQDVLMLAGGTSMIVFAGYKVMTRFRHRSRIGMRVRMRDLVAWSFIVATAHGAGLMIVPSVLALRAESIPMAAAHSDLHQHHAAASATPDGLLVSLLAVGVHTFGMLAVAGAIAFIVFRKVGVEILRTAWINMDLIWVGALLVVGSVTLSVGTWSAAVG